MMHGKVIIIAARAARLSIEAILCLALAGCGVGGFQGPDNTYGSQPANALMKRLGGIASKGPLNGSRIEVYNLNSNGSVGALLTTTVTNSFGQYSSNANISGPFLIKASGGSYLDEGTGQTLTLPDGAPLRAALDTVSTSMTVAVTPLTELAVRQAGNLLLANNIVSANQLISRIFRVNVVATQPIAPTVHDFDGVGVSTEQKDYALALAGISRMASDYYGGSVSDCLAAMASDLAVNSTLSVTTGQQFQAALQSYLASAQNQSGVTNLSASNLVNAGGGSLTLKLATTGTPPAGATIYGVSLRLTLPPGATIDVSDFVYYQADSSVVYTSGTFSNNQYTTSYFQPQTATAPATLNLVIPQTQGNGASVGEFATVIVDLPVGSSYKAADFSLSNVEIIDNFGLVIPGLGVSFL